MRVNMHTHSIYCDGKDTPEEMVQTAIEKGFDILGFSGHGYTPWDDCGMDETANTAYCKTVNELKQRYRKEITIYLGIEQDKTCRIPSKDPYDFVIASVHMLEHEGTFQPVDYSPEVFQTMLEEWYDGDFLKMAGDYYRLVAEQGDFEEADIIGHIDLLTKYNEDESYIRFDDPSYLALVEQCIDTLGNKKIYEVNTGAIARGYRKSPYPHKSILQIMKHYNCKLMLNSDCHNRHDLDCAFEESLKMIKDCGFKELYILKDREFIPVDIEAFH